RSWSTRRDTPQIVRRNASSGDYAFAGSSAGTVGCAVAERVTTHPSRTAPAPTAPAAANDQAGPALSMTRPANGAPAAAPSAQADPSSPGASPREVAGTIPATGSVAPTLGGAQT